MDSWIKEKELGKGGFGVVSLWRNKRTNKLLALKCCKNDSDHNDESHEYWSQEMCKMAKLNHPNIIKVEPLPESLVSLSSYPILCMEFCTGGDLRKELCKPESICGLPEDTVRSVLDDMKEGIKYLHSVHITHRDLKPENIVLHQIPNKTDSSTKKIVYKLIDFGFAKEWDQSSLCSTFLGTLHYIAPEVFSQHRKYNRSVDYWSMGLICHEIITGFRPFDIDVSLPSWLDLIKKKRLEDICIYETVDGEKKYCRELYPENHISQPLKYALEKWLRIALESEGLKRGKIEDIFSSLESALKKRVVTIFCVSKLERLSYEIDESTLTRTLKLWVLRDTDIHESDQLILLPSGESLDDQAFVLSHCDYDPKLVAMFYVMSKSEGLKLPTVERLQSNQPILVSRMLESASLLLPYHIIRRIWANSVYFIESTLNNYRAFIEAYSVKMLSLIVFKKTELLQLERYINSVLESLLASFNLSKKSLEIDLKNITLLYDINTVSEDWRCDYQKLRDNIYNCQRYAEELLSTLPHRLTLINRLKEFEDPGLSQSQRLAQLLNEGRNLYCTLIKVPFSQRNKKLDSLSMAELIYQLWNIFNDIASDQLLIEHLNELTQTEKEVISLTMEMTELKMRMSSLQNQVSDMHLERQNYIWKLFKDRAVSEPIRVAQDPQRRISLENWHIS